MCSYWSLPRGLIDLTSDVILTSPSPHPILTLALALGGCSLVSGVHPGGGPGGSLGCIGGGPEALLVVSLVPSWMRMVLLGVPLALFLTH